MMKKWIFLLGLLMQVHLLTAQTSDQQLAQHYYGKGEFDKALIYYEKLYDKDPSKFYFSRYLECLEATGDEKTAEKVLKKEVGRHRGDAEYAVMLASFYEERGDAGRANDIYSELIDDMQPSSHSVIGLYNVFKAQGKSDLAYRTLVEGRKMLKKSYPLNFQFAEYYGSVGDTKKMMEEYLDMIDYHPSYMSSIQRVLSTRIDFSEKSSEEYEFLRTALIERTQKNPDDMNYAEMLTWLFVQRKDFAAALTHIKAMDKRSGAEGRQVYEFGNICVENKDFSTARRAFQYVVGLGEESLFFMRAQNALLNVSFQEITTRRNFTQQELNEVIANYESVLEHYGKRHRTLSLVMELAHIKAFYANQGAEALALLNEALEFQGLTDMQRAEVKMELADIHVLHGDVWEASLLYMQVDKEFKYEPIGHEAKFKNARIFYYDGEFDFAQSQLDVLKQSTSKLIANDALKLSLLITDNYGLDSNYTAMSQFAHADLLIEQHRYEEAFALYDSITDAFPAHSLGDEILLRKAYAMQLRGEWNKAIEQLEKLLKFYNDDILADDALFQLGDIYENHLMDKEKAAEYYRTILFEYKGSLYSTEARKRFRAIRNMPPEEGDELEP